MRGALSWLTAVGSSCLLAVGAVASPYAASRPVPTAQPTPAAPAAEDDRELQGLLQKLSELSEIVGRNAESPQVWPHQVAQGEVMLRIAARSKGKEREDWLRTAVDSHYSAAVQAPDSDPSARQRLEQLSEEIARAFPGSAVSSYAALQEVQADYVRMLTKNGDDPTKAQLHLRNRLVRFAEERPTAPEAPKAVMEAGQLSESLKKPEEARQCYRYLADRYAGTPVGRKAVGSLWRLGLEGEPMRLALPLLFPTGASGDQPFDLAQMRGKIAIVYFWSCTSARASDDFQALKALTDRYRDRGLEAVYVNLDNDANQARLFLSGRIMAGTHVFQHGGLDSPVAERYGIKALPEVFLIGRDGKLMRHSLQVPQVEAAIAGQMPRAAGRVRR